MASNISSRLFKVALGLALMGMGAGGTIVLWRSWQRAEETRTWKPVEAVVISSQVLTDRPTPHSPLMYTADVHYRYTMDGKGFTSRRVKRVQGPTSHKEAAEATAGRYRAGKMMTCYVNPAEPDFAILEHDSRAGLYTIWFPLLFVIGGAGMVLAAVKRETDLRKARSED
jgi:hypothetical protein